MIHTLLIDAISGGVVQNGMVRLVISSGQLAELQDDITDILSLPPKITMQTMRNFHYLEEGFIPKDRICRAYWTAHHD